MSTLLAQAMAISAALPDTSDRDRRIAKYKSFIRKVLETLPERPHGMTRPEIVLATGLAHGSVKYALSALQRDGLVDGTPKTGRNFSKYWRL